MSILDTIIRLNLANNVADAAKLAASATGLALAIGEVTSFYKNKINAENPRGDLVFPTDLLRSNDTTQDLFFIKFQFKNYEKRSQQTSKIVKITGPGIKLPIPKSLRDNLSVSYDAPPLGAIAGVVTDAIAGGGGNDKLGIDQYLNNIRSANGALATVEAAIAPFTSAGAAVGVQQFAQSTPGQVLQSLTGIAPNAYQTWLFKHPNFRNHNFSWTLAPESPEESDIIRQIVKYFQKNMLPAKQLRNNALLLQYPSLVYMQLFAGSPQNSTYLYDFKPCVLKSVSADYAAAGRPAFFTSNNQRGVSGAPAAVTLSMELQEIEFWTSDDIAV